ncbi:hypothetical protein N7493_005180 [Penicillium malachiteum]|uniref:Uncharacterized protein n=1 Tax=Penicillium malachiteum TaxID=1324776 RepID=A0AAD6HM59_9EURO|nr:hypothetical protein N7493_005180 [Penicillium malachiteum]
MSQNSTTPVVLDCSDSPLSVTGNVIGIITFVYAVFIPFLYRSKTLVRAKDETRRFYTRANRVYHSLVEAQKRIEAYFTVFDLTMNKEIRSLLEDAKYWSLQYKPDRHEDGLVAKGTYLLKKEDMARVLEGMLETQARLDGTYQVDLNAKYELPQKRAYVDMSEIYLNPSEVGWTEDKEDKEEKEGEDRGDRGDIEEPSQMFQGPEPERPPVCDCGQSDTPDSNGNPRICSDAYGEPLIQRKGYGRSIHHRALKSILIQKGDRGVFSALGMRRYSRDS